MNLILEAVKKALVEGKATVNLNEASAITGSGSGIGGNVVFDDAYATLREANVIRQLCRVTPCAGSDMQFVAKTGNATVASPANPWGYGIQNNVGSPDTATNIWQIAVKCLNARLPIRSAVLGDINGLQESIVGDIMLEFASLELASMTQNSDASGSATTAYGGEYGLRGLDSYAFSTSEAAYGSSGTGDDNGRHTILGVDTEGADLSYNMIVATAAALPPQYWGLPNTAWMMHPKTLATIRDLKDDQKLPLFLDIGMHGEQYLFGWPIVLNPYMDYIDASIADVSGTRFIYLANWPRFYTIGDQEEMTFQMFEQTQPGFVNIYAEKRVVSSILDPFAGVVLGSGSSVYLTTENNKDITTEDSDPIIT